MTKLRSFIGHKSLSLVILAVLVFTALTGCTQDSGFTSYNIASKVIYEDGTSEGTFIAENVATNDYVQSVEIHTKDDNTLIYQSEIPVGKKLEGDKLLVDLPAGEYECLAYISDIDPETGEKLNTVGFNVGVTINN